MKLSGCWTILRHPSLFARARQYDIRGLSTKVSDPLRILFCGSEDFSIASLRAVHDEHIKDPNLIASIDVVCKPGKRVGRGLKGFREVPIKAVAEDLNLPVHEIPTFTGWNPPEPHNKPINLIVAVSFGLLVPPRILSRAKYGGLNVHPSLLPDFRGPAPLHHTLLSDCKTTGITLQTLHPSKFDHGTILAQTAYPIPNPETCTVPQLLQYVAPKGAAMLVRGLRDRVFVPPYDEVERPEDTAQSLDRPLRRASMIHPEDSHINWGRWPAEEIVRKNRVLGPLWSEATFTTKDDLPTVKRIIFDGISLGRETTDSRILEPGNVTIARAKVEGGVEKEARKALTGLKWGGKLILR
ncbi:MAG: Methionyl-tRNA formyltransferase [Candelina mexicana]|nr:MAG: Methionyl-tRNA formyltransferase [Candelina mexicana]